MDEAATMEATNPQQIEREAQRAQVSRGELVQHIARAVREDGSVEPLRDAARESLVG